MKILVRYDVPTWAFARRARSLKRYAVPPYSVTIQSNHEAAIASDKVYQEIFRAVLLCDMTASPHPYNSDYDARIVRFVGSHAWLYPVVVAKDWRTLGVLETRNAFRAQHILRGCDAVGVHNTEQKAGLSEFHSDIQLMPYLVDRADFYPENRTSPPKLRVGWCYQTSGGPDNFKGYEKILKPLKKKLGESVDWRIRTPDPSTAMDTETLRAYYNSCDVFLCTSSAEGGPQGPFEAAACGCAVLSTDVGQVSDWGTLRQLDLLAPAYRNPQTAAKTIGRMAEVLLKFSRDPSKARVAGETLQASIEKSYDAKTFVPSHLAFIAGDA